MVNSVKLNSRLSALLLCLALLCSSSVYPQVTCTGAYQEAADSTGIAAKTKTSPPDDSVLDSAPKTLDLLFPQGVRLVKLTLHNDRRDWVDISFRYTPEVNKTYVWNLPDLQLATYYTADWAILGASEQLVRGSFSFSFGSGAEPPSVTREAEAILLELRTGVGDPTTRYVTPPRTQIIINRDPPHYDPPFTIELEVPEEAEKVDMPGA